MKFVKSCPPIKRGNYFTFSVTTANYGNEQMFSRLHHPFISFIRCCHPKISKGYGMRIK